MLKCTDQLSFESMFRLVQNPTPIRSKKTLHKKNSNKTPTIKLNKSKQNNQHQKKHYKNPKNIRERSTDNSRETAVLRPSNSSSTSVSIGDRVASSARAFTGLRLFPVGLLSLQEDHASLQQTRMLSCSRLARTAIQRCQVSVLPFQPFALYSDRFRFLISRLVRIHEWKYEMFSFCVFRWFNYALGWRMFWMRIAQVFIISFMTLLFGFLAV